MWVKNYFILCSLFRREIREFIIVSLSVLEDLGIHTSHMWMAFNGPVVNQCPMGPAGQPLRPRGAAPSSSQWNTSVKAKWQRDTTWALTLWFPRAPQGTRCSICCPWGPYCLAIAMSTSDHTRASRHSQLKGWNSSFYWTSGLTHINYSTLSSRITESFISYLSKTTYQPTAFRLQSLPSARVEPSHVKTWITAAPLSSPTLMAAAPLMGAWTLGAAGIAPSTLLLWTGRGSLAEFNHGTVDHWSMNASSHPKLRKITS